MLKVGEHRLRFFPKFIKRKKNSQTFVFNGSQKMALRALYLVKRLQAVNIDEVIHVQRRK